VKEGQIGDQGNQVNEYVGGSAAGQADKGGQRREQKQATW
jgi:hypothetical protein